MLLKDAVDLLPEVFGKYGRVSVLLNVVDKGIEYLFGQSILDDAAGMLI